MSIKKMNVEFSSFRIREVTAKDHREPGPRHGRGGEMELAPEVSFGCLDGEKKAPFTAIVVVKLSAILKKARATSKTPPTIQALIEGEAQYKISGVSLNDFHRIFVEHEFLDSLAGQTYPLVSYKMDRLLSEMGVGTEFPLSLPEIADRIQADALKDIISAPEKKLSTRKTKLSTVGD